MIDKNLIRRIKEFYQESYYRDGQIRRFHVHEQKTIYVFILCNKNAFLVKETQSISAKDFQKIEQSLKGWLCL